MKFIGNVVKIILFIIFLPFVPLYFIYKSSRLSKKYKIILFTLYIFAIAIFGYINGSDENESDKNIAFNDNSVNLTDSNIKQDSEEVKDTNSEISNEDKNEPVNTDTTAEDNVEQEDSQQVVDVQNYTSMVSTWAMDFSGNFGELSDLLINNNVESTSWNKKVVNTSYKLIEDCKLVVEFKPPTGFEEINENIVNACTNYMYGITDLLDGLRELDEEKIESAQMYFILGNGFINIATEQLNDK